MTGTFIKFLLCLLLIPTAYAGMADDDTEGLRWAYHQAEFYLPGIITLNSLDGSLIGPIHITGLEYSEDGASYKAARMTIDWQPGALFSARIIVNQLNIQSLRIFLAANRSASTGSRAGSSATTRIT